MLLWKLALFPSHGSLLQTTSLPNSEKNVVRVVLNENRERFNWSQIVLLVQRNQRKKKISRWNIFCSMLIPNTKKSLIFGLLLLLVIHSFSISLSLTHTLTNTLSSFHSHTHTLALLLWEEICVASVVKAWHCYVWLLAASGPGWLLNEVYRGCRHIFPKDEF